MAKVNPNTVVSILSVLYKMVLREMLKKAIEDPNSEWDEWLIEMLDKLLNYSQA